MKRLKTEMGAVIAVLCLGSFCTCGESGKLPHDLLESPEWMVNGHPAPSSAMIQQLTDSIIPQLGKHVHENRECSGTRRWEVDTVAEWHGRTVVDLFRTVDCPNWEDTTQRYPHKEVKATAIETEKGKYRLAYLSWSPPDGIYYGRTQLFRAGKSTILYTDSPMSGSGGYHDEARWIWDTSLHVPVCTFHRSVMGAVNRWARNGDVAAEGAREFDEAGIVKLEENRCFSCAEHRFVACPEWQQIDSLIGRYTLFAFSPVIYTNWEKVPYGWQADTIGMSAGRPITEISFWFHCPPCRDTLGKIIAIANESGRFRPIYLELTLPGEPTIGKNYLVPLGTDTVIAVEGTVYEKPHKPFYWVWPKNSEVPVCLYQDWVLNETLTLLAPRWLPSGLVARPGKGKWDFFKLTYETPIWREGEADSDPSGGTLFVQFGLHDTRLIPVSFSYTLPDATGAR